MTTRERGLDVKFNTYRGGGGITNLATLRSADL